MQIVKVRLRKPTRVYSFLCEDIELKRDEHCIVETERGIEFGACVLPPEPCTEDVKNQYSMHVLRRAHEEDEADFARILEDEVSARAICRECIETRRLPMKIVDAEYTFDRHKVILYFTADERVDFRELVRELAKHLKTRIELRHIQVRDEAKLIGGIGVCGRELCCSTWLREFQPISMKMAKRQNLSLNPAKISGQCGRLLCCLSYENELYQNKKSIVMAEREAEQAAKAARREAEGGHAESEWPEEDPFPDAEIYTAYAGGRPPSLEELDDPGDAGPSAVADISAGDSAGEDGEEPEASADEQEESPKKSRRSKSRRGKKRGNRRKRGGKGGSSSNGTSNK
ncbi:MAG: stage 0 sporulation family protein [Candidatus Hydrogenedentota bacterium]